MLSSLPSELVGHIAQGLDRASLCSFRLANKTLQKKSFQCWAKQFFTSVRTDLSSDSLQRLLAIGNTESLRQHVQNLFIRSAYRGDFGAGLRWSRTEEGRLLDSQSDLQLLQNLLCQKMPNCRSFYIHGPDDAHNESLNLTITDVTTLVLNLIAETALNVRSFTVDLKGEHPTSGWHGSGLLCAPLLQPSLIRQKKQFREGWAHLQQLHLHLDIRSDTVAWARDLVQLAPTLKSLSLTLNTVDREVCQKILALELPPLQELYLRCTYVTEAVLSRFLHSSRQTLKALKLRSIHLDGNGDWGSVLRSLRTDYPQLENISLSVIEGFKSSLRGSGDMSEMSQVVFPALARDPQIHGVQGEQFDLMIRKLGGKLTVRAVTYKGKHMAKALTMLEESLEYYEPLGL